VNNITVFTKHKELKEKENKPILESYFSEISNMIEKQHMHYS